MASFKFDANKLIDNLNGLPSKMDAAVLAYAQTAAQDLEDHAKANAPWTDRSTMARKSLKAAVIRKTQTCYRITLSHGVSYGIWLELAHEKKWAIVKPTIELKSSTVLEGFKGMMDKMK